MGNITFMIFAVFFYLVPLSSRINCSLLYLHYDEHVRLCGVCVCSGAWYLCGVCVCVCVCGVCVRVCSGTWRPAVGCCSWRPSGCRSRPSPSVSSQHLGTGSWHACTSQNHWHKHTQTHTYRQTDRHTYVQSGRTETLSVVDEWHCHVVSCYFSSAAYYTRIYLLTSCWLYVGYVVWMTIRHPHLIQRDDALLACQWQTVAHASLSLCLSVCMSACVCLFMLPSLVERFADVNNSVLNIGDKQRLLFFRLYVLYVDRVQLYVLGVQVKVFLRTIHRRSLLNGTPR